MMILDTISTIGLRESRLVNPDTEKNAVVKHQSADDPTTGKNINLVSTA